MVVVVVIKGSSRSSSSSRRRRRSSKSSSSSNSRSRDCSGAEALKRLGAGLGKASSLRGYDSGMIRGHDSARCKTALITNS